MGVASANSGFLSFIHSTLPFIITTLVSIAVGQLNSPVIQQEMGVFAGVTKELENLSHTLNGIQAMIKEAEEKQVKDEHVRVWLEDLKNVAYDIDDLCDEWRTTNSVSHDIEEEVDNALIGWCKKVCSCFFSACFGFNQVILRCNIGHRIKDISKRLDVIEKEKNEGVAQMVGTTYMRVMGTFSNDECWYLLSSIAFSGWEKEESEQMEEIGREIAKKCKGLPLSAKILGGLLHSKRTKLEWENVLTSELWDLKDVEQHIIPALWLSYIDLPSHLKRCFQHCAVFPKDYVFHKHTLVKSWMAQGCIRSQGGDGELEVKGEEYFNDLVKRSFFQDQGKDMNGNVVHCKIHHMVHDFAQILTKNECFVLHSNNNARDWNCKSKVRHSIVDDDSNIDSSLSTVCKFKNLRTLIVRRMWEQPSSLHALPSDLFCKLTCLRELDLSSTSIKELPSEVGKLIHLRYLNLHNAKLLRKLPESVSNLYNLQVLVLTCCSLDNLPEGIGKLISLRHLEIDDHFHLSYLPRGIGRLSSLQALPIFIVGGGAGGCNIRDLKDLNFIGGNLKITGLGYETNVNDAKEAGLRHKQHLRCLDLDFHFDASASVRGEDEEDRMEGVIEGLQPHPNLEELYLLRYPGTKLPKNWLMMSSNLVELRLTGCRKCMQLPHTLGKLPLLKKLALVIMDAVTRVGREFFGMEDADDGVNVFPKLTELEISELCNWEEWEDISIMPCLSSLILQQCPKLKALPHFLKNREIKELCIHGCSILDGRCQKEVGEDWSKISHIPYINNNYKLIQ